MAEELKNFEILLGVTGGIAAYKSAQLCSDLVKCGASVTVAMTQAARQFVRPLTFSTLSGRCVYTDMFDSEQIYDARHISLTRRADLIIVAPATANILAKMANGIGDDLLSTLLIAAESDIMVAPAMNFRMWENHATRRNVDQLREWGCHFVGPESGRLACGESAQGRMSEPQTILERIIELLKDKSPKYQP